MGGQAGEGRGVLALDVHDLLRGELLGVVPIGPAIHPRVEEGVVVEGQAQLLGQGAHGRDLMGVGDEGHGLELQGQPSRLKPPYPGQALLVGAGDAGDLLVGLLRRPVEA